MIAELPKGGSVIVRLSHLVNRPGVAGAVLQTAL